MKRSFFILVAFAALALLQVSCRHKDPEVPAIAGESADSLLIVRGGESAYSIVAASGRHVTTLTVPTTTESESMFYAAGRYYVNFYAGSAKGAMLYEIVPELTFKYPNN